MTRSFRMRLALRATGVMAIALIAVSLVSLLVLRFELTREIDATVLEVASIQAASLTDEASGEMQFHDWELTPDEVDAVQDLVRYAQVWQVDGESLLRSQYMTSDLPVEPAQLARAAAGEIVWTSGRYEDVPVRILYYPLERLGAVHERHVLQVAAPLRSRNTMLTRMGLFLALLSTSVSAAVFGGAWWLAGRAMRPVHEVMDQAEAIGAGSLERRINAYADTREYQRLVAVLNTMLDRIQGAFETQRRFTSDASHELRSPLTAMRGELELALRRERDPSEYRQVLASSLEEVVRLSRITEDLLILARSDAGALVVRPEPLEVAELQRLATEVEAVVRTVPGTRSAIGERVVSGSYLDIDIDRDAAARYGISVDRIQMVIASAIGGMGITRTVEGRERYSVRVRYPQELRDQPEKLEEILIPVGSLTAGMEDMASPATMAGIEGAAGSTAESQAGSGTEMAGAMEDGGMAMAGGQRAQIPLGQVARIRTVAGPMSVKTEQAFPTAWVFVDVNTTDLGSYVADAREMVSQMVELPAGYSMTWSGQYEYMQRAKERLTLVVPATLVLILLLLYLNFGRIGETLIVMLSLPFSLVGGVLIMALLGFHWSVATGVGFIALAGVAAEIGVIMLLYLGNAWEEHRRRSASQASLREAIIQGAALRVRPILMTVTAIVGGLLPIFWGHGTGATVMRRIAAPMVGGMTSATVLALLVIPAVYSLWQEALLRREARAAERALTAPGLVPAAPAARSE